jgi:type IV pilus assembly protein PilW
MRHAMRGFSLIELMIAVTLGMLAVAAVGSVFIYGSRNYKQDDKISRMQDELRFAMAQLTLDLEMAGFFAQVRDMVNDIDVDVSATVAKDCGPTTDGAAVNAANNWTFNERRASIFTGGDADADGSVDGAEAAALFPCIDPDEFLPGTDIVAIKRLGNVVCDADAATPIPACATVSFEAGRAYLRTNGVETTIYRHPSSGPPPKPTTGEISVYEFRPVVWYVRNYSVTPDEKPLLPALCRKVLDNTSMVADQGGCLAQGIADMQLEFGFDSDGNGVADSYMEYGAAPSVTTLSQIVAVRVHLLAQSAQPDVDYKNAKVYTVASKVLGPFNDGYYRRTLSSIVLLRNPMNKITPYSLPSG